MASLQENPSAIVVSLESIDPLVQLAMSHSKVLDKRRETKVGKDILDSRDTFRGSFGL